MATGPQTRRRSSPMVFLQKLRRICPIGPLYNFCQSTSCNFSLRHSIFLSLPSPNYPFLPTSYEPFIPFPKKTPFPPQLPLGRLYSSLYSHPTQLLPDVQTRRIQTHINSQLRQDSSTSGILFSVPRASYPSSRH